MTEATQTTFFRDCFGKEMSENSADARRHRPAGFRGVWRCWRRAGDGAADRGGGVVVLRLGIGISAAAEEGGVFFL